MYKRLTEGQKTTLGSKGLTRAVKASFKILRFKKALTYKKIELHPAPSLNIAKDNCVTKPFSLYNV